MRRREREEGMSTRERESMGGVCMFVCMYVCTYACRGGLF